MAIVTRNSGARPPPEAAERRAARHRRLLSPLTRRILAINLLAPALLAGGLMYLGQYRAALIDQRIESLFVQAELIAGALGESAIAEADLALRLSRPTAEQIIRRLVAPTGTRARLFDEAGRLIVDSRFLASAGRDVILRTLPPPSQPTRLQRVAELLYDLAFGWLPPDSGLPPYREHALQRVDDYAEALEALGGEPASALRDAGDGTLIISVAVPVQGLRKVVGALMLSVDSAEIEQSVREVRIGILQIFAAVLVVTVLMSFFLAGTIARPVRRLAEAADRVRAARGRKVHIPDFTARRDEIGDLSAALRDMTAALYLRLDAIEAFAADVAHEIKNPLTSLRSAVETMGRTNDPEKQRRLIEIIQEDVARLDRLISDISDASRLDAELARAELQPVDVGEMLTVLAGIFRDTAGADAPRLELSIDTGAGALVVPAIGERLGQVFRNLLANAVSFSPRGGTIWVRAAREGDAVWFSVEDEGPGIPEGKLEAIFDRFYTERPPGEAFGTHSGLGLSISRQIVGSLGGTIVARNRTAADGRIVGACFTVRLPA